MAYTKKFVNPHPNGWDNPSERPPITTDVLQAHTDAIQAIDDYLAAGGGTGGGGGGEYVLPVATSTILGGVKVDGDTIAITADGTISVSAAGGAIKNTGDLVNTGDGTGSRYVNESELATVAFTGTYSALKDKPTIPTKTSELINNSGFITTIPQASTTTLGGIKIDENTLTINNNGVVSVIGGTGGASYLADLNDTQIVAPLEGQTIIFNSKENKWLNAKLEDSIGIANLKDVAFSDNLLENDIMLYDAEGEFWANTPISQLPLNLDDLKNTAISSESIQNGDVLAYDSASSTWINKEISAGATSLTTLQDVAIDSPTTGQGLVYDEETQMWVNGNIASGGEVVTSAEVEWGIATLKTDLQVATPKGYTIPFDQFFSKSTIEIDEENHGFILKAGKTYELEAIVRTLGASEYRYFQFYNNNTQTLFGILGCSETIGAYSDAVVPAKWIGSVDEDTLVTLRCVNTSSETSTTRILLQSRFSVTELKSLVTYAQNASNNYSTEEQVVGTWIDGKPLYQKTYDITGISISANTWYDYIIDNTDIDFVTKIEGYRVSSNKKQTIPMNQYKTSDSSIQGCTFLYNADLPGIAIRPTAANTDTRTHWYVTIQYTKTTD